MKITNVYLTYYSDNHIVARIKAEDQDTGISLNLEMTEEQVRDFTTKAENIVNAELEQRMQKTINKGFEGRLALESKSAIDIDATEETGTPF